jgi:hypothetical protein
VSHAMDEQQAARILDEALTARQRRSGAPIAEPALANEETAQLLMLADKLGEHLAPAGPTRAAVARTRARVLNRIGARRRSAERSARPTGRPSVVRRYAFALASIFLIFALLASGTGVAYAAEGSLPGDGLYGVKLGLESTRLALTFSPQARGDYLRGLADERLSEIQSLLQEGRNGDLPAAVDSYGNTLNLLEGQTDDGSGPNLVQTQATLQHHLEILAGLLASAPEPARSGLENALSKSQHGLDVLNAKEQGINPNELAPGQLKKTPSPDDTPGNGPPSDHAPGPPGGPPGQNGSPGNGNGPPADHTPGPPGGPPGQNKDGGPGGSQGGDGGNSGSAPGRNR